MGHCPSNIQSYNGQPFFHVDLFIVKHVGVSIQNVLGVLMMLHSVIDAIMPGRHQRTTHDALMINTHLVCIVVVSDISLDTMTQLKIIVTIL